MSCCPSHESILRIDLESSSDQPSPESTDNPTRFCQSCGGARRTITRKTLFLMLKPEFLDLVADAQYEFCPNPRCSIVYCAQNGSSIFTVQDLRIRVGVKESGGRIPLCYCFGFDEADIRKELAASGQTTIPEKIATLIRDGLCACSERNPSGACCLGEVNKAVKRIATVELKSK